MGVTTKVYIMCDVCGYETRGVQGGLPPRDWARFSVIRRQDGERVSKDVCAGCCLLPFVDILKKIKVEI